jgi:hypothetical protein
VQQARMILRRLADQGALLYMAPQMGMSWSFLQLAFLGHHFLIIAETVKNCDFVKEDRQLCFAFYSLFVCKYVFCHRTGIWHILFIWSSVLMRVADTNQISRYKNNNAVYAVYAVGGQNQRLMEK